MATRRYKISAGETEFDVVEEAGAAVNSDHVEITVELATTAVNLNGASTRALTKSEVLQMIDMIKNHIMKNEWSPA